VLLSVAEVVRYRREGNRAKARSREEEARRQASEQRLAIAREVHDVVAHHMSLINVQASAALHLMDADPERARVALTAIKGASKDALVDLRSLLGVLRRVDEDLPREPARGMRDLDELVARASAAGLEVRVVVGGERRDLPSAVDLAAYRIVQEALTNVARHAIGATTVTIGLGYGAEDLVIEVSDDGRGAPVTVVGAASARDGHESHTAGSGISGMRERCATLGGTLEAGPGPEGGFRVRAWLPVTAPGGDR
jgi:signal transduction histidine kinase